MYNKYSIKKQLTQINCYILSSPYIHNYFMVEAAGVEPASKNASSRFSPSAVAIRTSRKSRQATDLI